MIQRAVSADGVLFLLVGNSGSGKDTLIKEVLRLWPAEYPHLINPRRHVTRSAHPSEPFHPLPQAAFDQLRQEGRYLFHWKSYGLNYGIPKEVLEDISGGHAVIVNVSREIVPEVRRTLARVRVVFVFAPLTVCAERIRKRGRETEASAAFAQRLKRAADNQTMPDADLVLDNSGPVEASAHLLCDYILKQCGFNRGVDASDCAEYRRPDDTFSMHH